MNVKKLIEEVLTDLGNNTPLDAIASKVQIIARLLKNEDFIVWVGKEFLTGYANTDELPAYRKSQSPGIKADYMSPYGLGAMIVKNQNVPIANLGTEKYKEVMEIRLYDALPTIEEYSRKVDTLSMSLNPYEQVLVQKVLGQVQVMNCHKEVTPSCFLSVIESVKSKLIDVFLDFNEKIFESTIDFNAINKKSEIQDIVHYYIPNAGIVQTGSGQLSINETNVISGTSNSLDSADFKKSVLDILNRIEYVSEGLFEEKGSIEEVLQQIKNEVNSPKPQKSILKMGFNAIKGIIKSVGQSGIEELVEEGLQKINMFNM